MFSLLPLLSFILLLNITQALPSAQISRSDLENLGKRQSEVQFTSEWPDQLVGGESISMSFEGSTSGKYTLAWVEEYNGGEDLLLNFVFQNEVYDHYDFYFAPSRCWKPEASFRFIVWDSEGFPLPEQRAYGPKLGLVPGDDEPDTC
ncbi:hypothetical protein I302_108046 [Kwoniella bestiolae CBS 10118]|uniref:Uncharacterized protein n=1 Tax=Kwoniella bestiolae CBS 10118 TaxID=1296100 RepID=A0A1B9FWT7_9TREE|nr:hypothetical protein I302_07588 [Kwoniella bestiolae CBS 10118]OCF23234.1 hypothetical protein I302_07588 [Kwoniella bestiolae CBS 10118]